MTALCIAVIGAGLIGRKHIQLVAKNSNCQRVVIVDPQPSAKELAQEMDTQWYGDLATLLKRDRVDGIILATPNGLHLTQALMCIEHAIPVLIEKPITHTVEEGRILLEALEKKPLPLLVGHHRMYSPILQTAHDIINRGALGELVSIQGSAQFYKPDRYFAEGPWRTKLGGGPILINLIHEISSLRYLCGDISCVQAISSNARRGYEVEDTVGIILKFINGTIGSFILSDTAASASSWEQTSKENPDYAAYPDEDCYLICGTRGDLKIPTMRLNTFSANGTSPSWWSKFDNRHTLSMRRQDSVSLQLDLHSHHK